MSKLEEKERKRVLDLIDQSFNAYSKESIEESIRLLDEAWSMIPDDKEQWDEGYLVSKEYIDTYFAYEDYNEAEKWIDIFLKADALHANHGDGQLLAGQVYFELGKEDLAKKYFTIADEKSKGRLWKGDSVMKYFKFYKEKK